MFLIEFWPFIRMIDNIIFQKSVKLWSSNKIPVLLVGEIDWTPSKIFFDYRKRKILLFSHFWTQILLIFQKSQGLNRLGPHLLNRTFCLCAFFLGLFWALNLFDWSLKWFIESFYLKIQFKKEGNIVHMHSWTINQSIINYWNFCYCCCAMDVEDVILV